MSTDTLREAFGKDTPLLSLEMWDDVKHTEGFIFFGATVFVLLFSFLFRSAPFLGGYHHLARTMLIWMIFVLAFDLLLGRTGLLSFGHAMFWGGAGYFAAFIAIYVHGDPLLMIFAGTVFALVLAVVTALILLRMHTVYFAIMTLAIAQLLYYLAREPLEPITRGINGLGVRPEPLFGVITLRDAPPSILEIFLVDYLYVLIGVFFIGTIVLITRIRKSPYGLIFLAIRENETRVSFVGLNPWRYKFAAYVLSGTIAGLAGSIYVIQTRFVVTARLYWETSGDVVVMAILGGMGSLAGPLIGAFIVRYFQGVVDGFAYVGGLQTLLIAVAFTAIVWKYSDGAWGMITAITGKARARWSDNE